MFQNTLKSGLLIPVGLLLFILMPLHVGLFRFDLKQFLFERQSLF